MAEDKNNEEEKFDFTPEGEGYISLSDARMLAVRTAAESPGDYGNTYQGVAMVFEVLESGEDADYYTVTLSVRPQGNFVGTAGQEQFLIRQDGTIAVRQVLSSPVRKRGGFPVLPVAIGVVVIGIIAAVGAVLAIGSSGGDRGETLAVEVTRKVPVTNVVTQEVPVTKIVTQEVPVTKIVTQEVPVTKIVTREVPVTKIVTQEVPTRTPTPVNPWCFVTGTPVLTSTGYIAIEKLQKGDTVLSYDHNFQTRVEGNISPLVEANIAAVVSRQVNGLKRVELADGTTIRVTSEHPFYSPDEAKYKPIGEFKLGERLGRIGQDEKLETIVVTNIKAVRGEFTVYNLSVESSHHNYVAAGVLVHNKTLVPPTPNATSYYNKGNDYFDDGNFQLAINELNTAIRLNPDFSDAYVTRSAAYANLGQHQQALQDANMAIKLDPGFSMAYNNRGFAYNDLGQYQNAISDYTKAIQLDPDNTLAYGNRGALYYDLGQYQNAINDSNKAIQLDPDGAEPYITRGSSYANLGQYQTAITDYTKAVQLDLGNANAFNNRNITYRYLGQYTLADADKTMACSLDSKYC